MNELVTVSPMTLIETAVSKGADVTQLEKLMALHERWESSQAKKSFLTALSVFQSRCPEIQKNKKGHNSFYAPLSDIVAQTRTILAECGLSYRFEQEHGDKIKVTCIVSHVDGHSEQTSMESDPDTSGSKNSIQAIGSAVQYLMRYTFISALGITTADSDMDGRIPDTSSFISSDMVNELAALMCNDQGNLTDKGIKLWNVAKLTSWDSITENQYKKIKQLAGVK